MVAEINPIISKIMQIIQLPHMPDPYDIAVFGDTLAVIGENNHALDLVSASTGNVEQSIPVPFYTAAVSADATGVYIASEGRTVAQFPVSTSGLVEAESPASRILFSNDTATGLGYVWFASNSSNRLVRISTSRQ